MRSLARSVFWLAVAATPMFGRCGDAADKAPAEAWEVVLPGDYDTEAVATAVTPDGAIAAAIMDSQSSGGRTARVWAWSTADRRVLVLGTLGQVSLPTCGFGWDIVRTEVPRVRQVEMSPCGRFVGAAVYGSTAFKVWETEGGTERFVMPLADLPGPGSNHAWVRRFRFLPDGATLAVDLMRWDDDPETGGTRRSEVVVLVDTATWTIRGRRVIVPTERVYEAAIRAEGPSLVAIAPNGGMNVWDLREETPRLIESGALDAPPVERVGPFPILSDDGLMVMWQEHVGRLDAFPIHWKAITPPQNGDFHGYRFSPDGQRLVATASYTIRSLASLMHPAVKRMIYPYLPLSEGSYFNDVAVWDSATGRLVDLEHQAVFHPCFPAVTNGRGFIADGDGYGVRVRSMRGQ